MFMGAIPRGFIKDGLQKVKACGAREEEEEATGEKGEDLELSAEEMDKTRRFIIGLFVIAKVKAHIPALFPGEGSLHMETATRIQGRN